MSKYTRLLAGSLLFAFFFLPQPVPAAEIRTPYQAAHDSIAAQEMFQTVDDLASPKFEGREAGSTGGRAAGDYLVEQFRKLPLTPAGERQGYFQPFGYNYRNILALLPGSDPALKDQTVIIGAHYDHLGHGRSRDNPPGTIYPGADDNASGTAGVLALAPPFPACRLPLGDRSSSSVSTARRRAFWARSTGRPNRPCRWQRQIHAQSRHDRRSCVPIGCLSSVRARPQGCGGWQA